MVEPVTAVPEATKPMPGVLVTWAGALAITLGGVVIVGWVFHLPRVTHIAPSLASMKINTALCMTLTGAVLVLCARAGRAANTAVPRLTRTSRLLAGLVAIVALATLLEYAAGVDLGIDQMLIVDRDTTVGAIPGRMSVVTAVCYVLLGIALALPPGRAGVTFSSICTLGVLVSFLSSIGYLYSVRVIYKPLPSTSIALHTAIGMGVLFFGALLTRPDVGWVKILMRRGSVGLMVRTLVPTLVAVPVLLGWAGLQGVSRDTYGPGGLMALSVTATIVLLTTAALLVARRAGILDDALREQQLVYRTVLGNSLDAFVMMDRDGRVLDWNEQASRVFGWSTQEAVGRLVEDLVIPASRHLEHRHGLLRFLETGQGSMVLNRQTVTACRRGGEEFAAELIVVPIETDGHWRFGGFVRDVSQQRAIEEQLRQAQKMEAIGQLTGGIAHDLNNLLTVVIGNLDFLVPHEDDKVARHATFALQATERGAALVHRLLAFSRRQTLAPEPIDLNVLVVRVHELIQRTIGEEVEIDLGLSGNLWPAFADPGQVENALLNMAVNARDAMPNGGTLTVETSNTRLDDDYVAMNPDAETGEYAMIAVTDTGIGMSADVQERAFEPFFTTKEVGKGSGLGLSMIYGFARQSRGHAKIYSEVGHGTTVRLYLPRVTPGEGRRTGTTDADVVPATGPATSRAVSGETILVVEDDEAVRLFVVTVLEGLGYQVLAAPDARAALAVIAQQPDIDLLFTDVVIPGGISGRQLAESAQRLLPDLKVIYTSGYTRDAIVHQGKLDAGVNFVPKPYRREELASKLRSVLRGEG